VEGSKGGGEDEETRRKGEKKIKEIKGEGILNRIKS